MQHLHRCSAANLARLAKLGELAVQLVAPKAQHRVRSAGCQSFTILPNLTNLDHLSRPTMFSRQHLQSDCCIVAY